MRSSRDLELTAHQGVLCDTALEFRRQIFKEEQHTSGIDEFDTEALHIVAHEHGGSIIATARIILPEKRPFDIEEYFNLNQHLPSTHRVAQIGRYCVRRDWRPVHRGIFLHRKMLDFSLALAQEHLLDGLICSVQPTLAKLYHKINFVDIGEMFHHPHYGQTIIMHLDIRTDEKSKRDASAPSGNLPSKRARIATTRHAPAQR